MGARTRPPRTAQRLSFRRGLLLAVLAGLVAVALFVPHAGSFLVREDAFAHADLAVVLSGGPISRALGARTLYREGRVDRFLVIPDPPGLGDEELVQLGLVDPMQPPWAERILLASGVPRDKIHRLPEPVDGTIAEAVRVRAFLKDDLPSSMVLVTSPVASHRARFIFRAVFRKEAITIFSFPTPYDPFEAKRWWAHPRNALTVVMEYLKWPVHVLTLALGRDDG